MKTIYTLTIFFIITLLIGGWSNNPGSQPQRQESGTLIVYRLKAFGGSASNFFVNVNGNKKCNKLKNGSYITIELEPGSASVTTKFAGAALVKKEMGPVDIEVEAGKTYYIRCEFDQKGLSPRVKMDLVEEENAQPELGELDELKCKF